MPVVPCHLDGAHAALPPHAALPRPSRIRLRIGKPLTFAGVANDREGWRDIAGALEAEVRGWRETMKKSPPCGRG